MNLHETFRSPGAEWRSAPFWAWNDRLEEGELRRQIREMAAAVEIMRQRGARRVGLSTQKTNLRSQRLYEQFGFRRTIDLDYRLFGNWISSGSVDSR